MADNKEKIKIKKTEYERLFRILSMQAESYDHVAQKEIAEEVISIYETVCSEKLVVEIDDFGNYYIVKGKADVYPTAVAHLDQVHDYNDKFYQLYRDGDTLFAIGKDKFGDYEQAGTGGDDLCGVWLCLELLIRFDCVKICLLLDEEVGCIGSGKADIEFFKDSAFVLQGDRRNTTSDWITRTNGVDVATEDFKDAVKPIIEQFGFSFNTGTLTDVGELVIRGIECCAANISCGYYDAHRDTETVVISEVFRTLHLMSQVFEDMGNQRWEMETPVKEIYVPTNRSSGYLPSSSTKSVDHCPKCKEKSLETSFEFDWCTTCGYYMEILENF